MTSEPQRGFQAASISAEESIDLMVAHVEMESFCLRMAIKEGDLNWEERLLGSAHRLRRTAMQEEKDPERLSEGLGQGARGVP